MTPTYHIGDKIRLQVDPDTVLDDYPTWMRISIIHGTVHTITGQITQINGHPYYLVDDRDNDNRNRVYPKEIILVSSASLTERGLVKL